MCKAALILIAVKKWDNDEHFLQIGFEQQEW